MNTCKDCWYFEPQNGGKNGNCLAEPPTVFIGQTPPGVLQRSAAPQPATFGIERVTRGDRKACRHFQPQNTVEYFRGQEKLNG